jgi:polygalacturonase
MINVKDFGAVGDNATNDAKSIDAAINACSASGGGTVYFPPGRYISGTIHLKDNIIIDISPGVTVAMSPDDDDFDDIEDLPYNPNADAETTYFAPSLFRLDHVENVCIQGGGIIDGNHLNRLGPKPIAVKQCKRITIRDIKVVNAPNYAMSFIDSEDITIENSIIDNAFADGIDFDGCRFAKVLNCHVSSVDDAMCLKSSPAIGKPINCEHILISNSTFLTEYTAFKIGSETGPGDFFDIVMNNCTLGRKAGLNNHPGGITIASLDGARVAGLVFSNISMHHIGTPVNIELGKRGRAQKIPTPGIVEDVLISNIIASDAISGCTIKGIPERRIRNIVFNNVMIHLENDTKAGLKAAFTRFGGVNDAMQRGCVFSCRHAENITVRNYQIVFPPDRIEIVPVACLDDTENCSIELNLPPSSNERS